MVRALEIERQLTKDQILDLYLTMAPYGGKVGDLPVTERVASRILSLPICPAITASVAPCFFSAAIIFPISRSAQAAPCGLTSIQETKLTKTACTARLGAD